MDALSTLLVIVVIALSVLAVWRQLDRRLDARARTELRALALQDTRVFEPNMVADLPEPARRFVAFTIAPGTPLASVFQIEMKGQLGTGEKGAPNYRPMRATQVLAPPYGFVWSVRAGSLQGTDGALLGSSWTRFWLFGVVPVVRASGADHHRSAFGRVVAEATFWSPASLLPSEFVRWDPVSSDVARATVQFGSKIQTVDISVDENGALTEVVIPRWSNENPEKEFRLQPFGGYPSQYRWFNGYRMPTHVEGGNHIGSASYFPFFIADVTKIDML